MPHYNCPTLAVKMNRQKNFLGATFLCGKKSPRTESLRYAGRSPLQFYIFAGRFWPLKGTVMPRLVGLLWTRHHAAGARSVTFETWATMGPTVSVEIGHENRSSPPPQINQNQCVFWVFEFFRVFLRHLCWVSHMALVLVPVGFPLFSFYPHHQCYSSYLPMIDALRIFSGMNIVDQRGVFTQQPDHFKCDTKWFTFIHSLENGLRVKLVSTFFSPSPL